MRMWAMTPGALLALAAADPASAALCATVSFSPTLVALPDYDPIAGGSVQTSFTATITRQSSATTDVRLIFLSSMINLPVRLGIKVGSNFGPLYQILDPSGVNVAFNSTASVTTKTNPKISLATGASGDSIAVNYLASVLANSSGADYGNGTYVDSLKYSIQCFQAGVTQASDTGVAGPVLSVTIPNLVSLTTASPQTLDFQSFTTLTQQLNIGLKSTGPINVNLTTQNQRKMVLAGAPSPAPLNSYIDYRITLNGYSVGSGPLILTNVPRAGVGGKSWPLLLTLPSQPSGKLAGSYSDTITLTVTPGT